jgi:hypothetical protein
MMSKCFQHFILLPKINSPKAWFFISMTQSYNIDQQWRLDGMHFIRMQEFYFALLTTIL